MQDKYQATQELEIKLTELELVTGTGWRLGELLHWIEVNSGTHRPVGLNLKSNNKPQLGVWENHCGKKKGMMGFIVSGESTLLEVGWITRFHATFFW